MSFMEVYISLKYPDNLIKIVTVENKDITTFNFLFFHLTWVTLGKTCWE